MAEGGAMQLLQGNHACALGAIAAGCRFFAGYPITPSSEIAERMARELPRVDGVFVQMEDEIASMGAVIGASSGGVKAMTATSGPGFSLKQENLGYAAATEIPCVVVNVMRGGPSTGMPTRPAQGDVMQARWGTHGDHPVIVLTPDSVQEAYAQTARAFNLAERLRMPVVVLLDEVIGHLTESVQLSTAAELEIVDRVFASGPPEAYQPYAADVGGVPAMARPGDGYRVHTTGLTHAESGYPTQDPDTVKRVIHRLLHKLDAHAGEIECYQITDCEDADIVVVAYGITARAAKSALRLARQRGLKVGLFRPVTLWPFPEQALLEACRQAHSVLVPEMNAGQLCLEVERMVGSQSTVFRLNRIDGEPIAPIEIVNRINQLCGSHRPPPHSPGPMRNLDASSH